MSVAVTLAIVFVAWMWSLGFVIACASLRDTFRNRVTRVVVSALWPITLPGAAILSTFGNGGDFS